MTAVAELASQTEVPPMPGEGEDLPAEGFVVFALAGTRYALPLNRVREIRRLPVVTPVPLAPLGVRGVTNHRGRAIPVADLRECCGLERGSIDSGTRMLVAEVGTPLGLIIDRVLHVRLGNDSDIDDVSDARASIGAELVRGVLHDHDTLTSVLDLDAVIDSLPTTRTVPLATDAISTTSESVHAPVVAEEAADLRFVGLRVDGQKYAVPLDEVREVVRMPLHTTPLPHTSADLTGVISLRGDLLPLFSLRRLLGLSAAEAGRQGRILVVTLCHTGSPVRVGLIADSVNDVLHLFEAQLRPVPPVVTDGRAIGVERVARHGDGEGLVSVLNVSALLGGAVVKPLETGSAGTAPESPGSYDTASGSDVEMEPESDRQFVGFRLGDVTYGIAVDDIHEVSRVPHDVTPVPDMPDGFKGICSLHGDVIPLLDISERMGLGPSPDDAAGRVMVAAVDGRRVGLLVDAVLDVRRVREDEMRAPDPLTTSGRACLTGLVPEGPDGKFMLIVEPSLLLMDADLSGFQVGAHA